MSIERDLLREKKIERNAIADCSGTDTVRSMVTPLTYFLKGRMETLIHFQGIKNKNVIRFRP